MAHGHVLSEVTDWRGAQSPSSKLTAGHAAVMYDANHRRHPAKGLSVPRSSPLGVMNLKALLTACQHVRPRGCRRSRWAKSSVRSCRAPHKSHKTHTCVTVSVGVLIIYSLRIPPFVDSLLLSCSMREWMCRITCLSDRESSGQRRKGRNDLY